MSPNIKNVLLIGVSPLLQSSISPLLTHP